MSRVTRGFLNEFDTKVSAPILEGFYIKECTSYIIGNIPIVVTQDYVDTNFLNSLNLFTQLVGDSAVPDCNPEL